jgi:uncharacterized membrane-anchored protein YhcB (DUF1043 family)
MNSNETQKLESLISASDLQSQEKEAILKLIPTLNQEKIKKLIEIFNQEKELLNQIDKDYQKKIQKIQTQTLTLDQRKKIVNNVVREVIKSEDQKKLDKTREELKKL